MSLQPLLSIQNLYKNFTSGDSEVSVLKNINIDIYAGEMIAIVGASGSGKSTLMNILGCLDTPSQGSYNVQGINISLLSSNELAKLRREHFGFIFQRYFLLNNLTAKENVEIPAIYANTQKNQREKKATELLDSLGLISKINFYPNQLSGGQQQRVSIARALINGGDVILADEPTGALDSKSGKEVLNILKKLNKNGHTIILVTHDQNIANEANRIIEIKDGEIINDTIKNQEKLLNPKLIKTYNYNYYSLFKEILKISINSILTHKLRSFLTMLGIIIGIASVVSVVALGKGSQQEILKKINALGTNTIDIYRGVQGERPAPKFIRTLTMYDVDAILKLPFVNSASPMTQVTTIIIAGSKSFPGAVYGVSDQYFKVRNTTFISGSYFRKNSINNFANEAVIDNNTKDILFPNQNNVIGKTFIIAKIPVKVIGVSEDKQVNARFSNDPIVWLPYSTVLYKLLGQSFLNNISVRINDDIKSSDAEKLIENLLINRHGIKDFTLISSDTIKKTVEQTTSVFTLFISSIAVISLIVGGIGVMNIMLVSVTERIHEIGLRMAVGARQTDILKQFLAESILICLIGALIGIVFAYIFGYIAKLFVGFDPIYSFTSIILAITVSCLIGIIFGYMPARNASKLNPVLALARE